MIISRAGKITERITLLGLPESCVYIVDGGDTSILMGGGMTYLAPDILSQLRDFDIDERKIRAMVILHAHFDHCGLIPFLKRRWPWARVMASTRAMERLTDSRISGNIAALNLDAARRAGREKVPLDPGFRFSGIEVEETLSDGDVISCGDIDLQVIEVPGHSTCSIAAYQAEEKALFASDAAGVRYGDFFMPAGNSNYDHYQQSLEKMTRYEVEVLLAEHFGALVGEDARKALKSAIEAAAETRHLIEDVYRRTRDTKKSTELLTRFFTEQAPHDFLGPEVLALVIGQMVRYISGTLEENGLS